MSNVASSGGLSVSVAGRGGMGMSGSSAGVRLGLSACEGLGWVSDSAVVCKAAGGVLSGGRVGVVSACVQRGSISGLLSYDGPSGDHGCNLLVVVPGGSWHWPVPRIASKPHLD